MWKMITIQKFKISSSNCFDSSRFWFYGIMVLEFYFIILQMSPYPYTALVKETLILFCNKYNVLKNRLLEIFFANVTMNQALKIAKKAIACTIYKLNSDISNAMSSHRSHLPVGENVDEAHKFFLHLTVALVPILLARAIRNAAIPSICAKAWGRPPRRHFVFDSYGTVRLGARCFFFRKTCFRIRARIFSFSDFCYFFE